MTPTERVTLGVRPFLLIPWIPVSGSCTFSRPCGRGVVDYSLRDRSSDPCACALPSDKGRHAIRDDRAAVLEVEASEEGAVK